MSQAAPMTPAPRPKSFAVTGVGLLTLLWGAAYAALGIYIIVSGAAVLNALLGASADAADIKVEVNGQRDPEAEKKAKEDLKAGAAGLGSIIAGIANVAGGCTIMYGAPMLLGGLGVLLRAGWGRVLTMLLAILALLEGLGFLADYQGGAIPITIGSVHVVYGLLTLIVLFSCGAEFARPKA